MQVTIDDVTYETRAVRTPTCEGCVAIHNSGLCVRLCRQSPCSYPEAIIWVKMENYTPRINPATKHNEIELALRNQQQLAQAIQDAGGSVHILENMTVPQLLQTLACNNITLKATYER